MKKSKLIIVGISVVLVVVLAIYGMCNLRQKSLDKVLRDYSKMLEGSFSEDLTLTIYYIDPDILTAWPLSAEEVISDSHCERIVVSSRELESNADILGKLCSATFKQLDEPPYANARMYYVFESPKTGKILAVALGGYRDPIASINGIVVEADPVLLEIIKPFMTEDLIEKWGEYMAWQGLQRND